jgi:poly(beta-D-mannuronate) C5 epimerase
MRVNSSKGTALTVPAYALLIAGMSYSLLGGSNTSTFEQKHQTTEYAVTSQAPGEIILPSPVIPTLTPYTETNVREKLTALDKHAQKIIEIRRMFGEITLHDFTAEERASEWAKRQSSFPKAIFIKSGVVTAQDIYQAIDNPQFFDEVEDGIFLTRLPVVIETGATLILEKDQTEQLRFSEERGAFFIVAGHLYAFNTQLIAWRESANSPATFVDENQFRPFLVSWSGSELYLVKTRVESFGYNFSKSYGLTVSKYSDQFDSLNLDSPKAWIIDSTFNDMYYGFYCYYADYLVLLNNDYNNSIVYGIDPHDYSRGLIIAHNTVHGTRQKHGIIVSREVNDSWIIRNLSYNNALSGFVIDRSSSGNIIAYNQSYENGSDGMTVYESPRNTFWENTVYYNGRHGIRARNSLEIKLYNNKIVGNGSYGVYGHVRNLDETDRDLEQDPYSSEVSLTLVGGIVGANKRGSLALDLPLSVTIYDVDFRFPQERGLILDGVLAPYQDSILKVMLVDKQAAVLKPENFEIGAN